MPLLRRNGGSFSELTVPRFAIPTPFHISYSHMSYRHNLYHLTHVTTEHAVQMRHFKMSNGVSPETHFQGKPSPEVWLLQVITYDLPTVCTPDTFIKYPKIQSLPDTTIQIDRSITKQRH